MISIPTRFITLYFNDAYYSDLLVFMNFVYVEKSINNV